MQASEEFEKILRESLRREPAPPDFAAKVMAQVRNERVVQINWWQRRSALLAMAAAIVVAAVIPPAVIEHQQHQQAVEAHRKLVLAMEITRSKLQSAKQKIQRRHS